jgi:hypothetical protein
VAASSAAAAAADADDEEVQFFDRLDAFGAFLASETDRFLDRLDQINAADQAEELPSSHAQATPPADQQQQQQQYDHHQQQQQDDHHQQQQQYDFDLSSLPNPGLRMDLSFGNKCPTDGTILSYLQDMCCRKQGSCCSYMQKLRAFHYEQDSAECEAVLQQVFECSETCSGLGSGCSGCVVCVLREGLLRGSPQLRRYVKVGKIAPVALCVLLEC